MGFTSPHTFSGSPRAQAILGPLRGYSEIGILPILAPFRPCFSPHFAPVSGLRSPLSRGMFSGLRVRGSGHRQSLSPRRNRAPWTVQTGSGIAERGAGIGAPESGCRCCFSRTTPRVCRCFFTGRPCVYISTCEKI